MLKSFIHDSDSKASKVMQTIMDVTTAAVPFLPPAAAEQLATVRFQDALSGELEKVNTFAELENELLLADLRALVRKIRSLDKSAPISEANQETIRAQIDKIASEVCSFAGFVSINFTAFRKITKKEAKVHRTASAAWFMANVARAPFMTVDFDRLLTGTAIVYDLLRTPLGAVDNLPSADRPATRSSLDRVLSAWVSSDDLWEVKVALSKTMTLDLLEQSGSRQSLIDAVLSSESKRGKEGPVQGHHKLRAIYLDTPWLESYKSQVSMGRDKKGFQVEIEGELAFISLPSGNQYSTSANAWEDLWERTSGTSLVASELVAEIRELKQAGYVPIVECTFSRYVFRCEDALFGFIDVRIEEDATFYNGKEKLLDKSSKFTSHALYITVPRSAPKELPDWLTDITGMPGVTEVPNFSKRTHGLFMFADNKIGAGVSAPSWAVQKPINIGRAKPRQASPLYSIPSGLGENKTPEKNESSGWLKKVKSLVVGTDGGKPQIRDSIVKIEPKSFFACERNLLDWTHTCVVVSGLAALQGGLIGLVIMGVPIVILLWETLLHRTRNRKMLNKEIAEYSDRFGPPLLLISLLGLIVNLFLSAILRLVAIH